MKPASDELIKVTVNEFAGDLLSEKICQLTPTDKRQIEKIIRYANDADVLEVEP